MAKTNRTSSKVSSKGKIPVATGVQEKTSLSVRLGSTLAATAVVTMLVGVWYLLALPVVMLTSNNPPTHGFSNDASNSVQLTWTSPGDDGLVGQATAYTVRYSIDPLSEGTWATASDIVGAPVPAVSGTQQSMVAAGLVPHTTYYFGLKTSDEAGNTSAISNIATATTACFESWSCTAWNQCANASQARTCTDLNACGTTAAKPTETQSCTATPVCTEDWQCSDWGACTDGSQTRTCSDLDSCGTVVNKPGIQRSCEIAPGQGGNDGIQETFIVTGSGKGAPPQVKIFNQSGQLKWQFKPYADSVRCGVNVVSGDLGADGVDEVAVAPAAGCEPIVKLFTFDGRLLNQFYAYDKKFRGGVNLAIGDVDNNGGGDIVTAPASLGGANIRIFSYYRGQYVPRILNFFAYDKKFRGGVSVAIGDVDANGTKDILTVPTSFGGPQVRIFEYRNRQFKPSALGFMAFPSEFRGGVGLATGAFGTTSTAKIVATPLSLGGPIVRQFERRQNGAYAVRNAGFFAFDPNFRGGVSVATGDFDDNGKDEIVVGVRSGGTATVRIFRNDGSRMIREFKAYPDTYKNGVTVSTGQFLPPR